MRMKRRIGVAWASVLLIGLTACTPDFLTPAESASDSPPSSSQPSSPEPSSEDSSSTAPTAPESTAAAPEPTDDSRDAPTQKSAVPTLAEGDPPAGGHGSATCADLGFVGDAVVPPELADLGVPFYECVEEAVAMPGSDPLFVGEYDSGQDVDVIEELFQETFDRSDWKVVSSTVEAHNAITRAHRPGYHLVVAIGPSRSAEAATSIHYTLRAQ